MTEIKIDIEDSPTSKSTKEKPPTDPAESAESALEHSGCAPVVIFFLALSGYLLFYT